MKTSKILIVLAIVAIVVVAALYFLVANIDAIVEAAIEKYGSRAAGTKVEVASVKIRLRQGEGSISGLNIRNPSGFSTPSAFTLGDITVAIDIGSLTKDPIVIDRVAVAAPRITYEVNEAGKANINQIKKNLEQYQGKPAAREKAEGEKNFLIRNLIIEGGEVDVRVAALPERPMSAKMPRVELTNVGGKDGASPAEIASQVLSPLINRAVQAAARTGVEQYVGKSVEDVKKALEEQAKEKLGGAPEEAVKGAEEAVKKLFGK